MTSMQLLTSIVKMIIQGIFYPVHLWKGYMQTPSIDDVINLAPGQGGVFTIDGKKVAVYKNEDGTSVKISAVCTHLGCIVGWNGQEKTWDCPCHGSKFSIEGKVLNGPAQKDLSVAE